MKLEKIGIKDFLVRSAGIPFRAKLLRTLSPSRGGQIPICAICFSDESNSFSIFNHLPVAERWDADRQLVTQEEIYETVILKAGSGKYDEIELGKTFQFSADWRGGAVRIGPVEVMEWDEGDRPEFFCVRDATIHEQRHLAESYEFLIEMLIDIGSKDWRLSSIPNHPLFSNSKSSAKSADWKMSHAHRL